MKKLTAKQRETAKGGKVASKLAVN